MIRKVVVLIYKSRRTTFIRRHFAYVEEVCATSRFLGQFWHMTLYILGLKFSTLLWQIGPKVEGLVCCTNIGRMYIQNIESSILLGTFYKTVQMIETKYLLQKTGFCINVKQLRCVRRTFSSWRRGTYLVTHAS